jgi:hypothetical protein
VAWQWLDRLNGIERSKNGTKLKNDDKTQYLIFYFQESI